MTQSPSESTRSPSGANALYCGQCTARGSDGAPVPVPLVFVPRAMIERESGRRAFAPVLFCPSCQNVEEILGYDFMAVTSGAAQLVAAVARVLAQEGGHEHVLGMLARIVQRFQTQINHEHGRIMRARLGIR